MTISATEAHCDDSTLWVTLSDGRVLGVPLVWFPRLAAASEAARAAVEVSPFGLHWEALDEDISVPALMADVVKVAAE
ncbi:DUF2442 domain-containing protein [Pseudaestuariivita atlantica]|uniref:DUF2442 domain-containing protein n=1 Tax=Pseudaestuariivita atlantica TaxID=1317121 RepID=A0A0L1JTW0_9RHOB|nr:DUF2442 domain-containing protein [Pseudaestuariivita atlantica]KNG95196.1 hypothetical protein ATO11_00695 [Pseudaestuariivita atlantica]